MRQKQAMLVEGFHWDVKVPTPSQTLNSLSHSRLPPLSPLTPPPFTPLPSPLHYLLGWISIVYLMKLLNHSQLSYSVGTLCDTISHHQCSIESWLCFPGLQVLLSRLQNRRILTWCLTQCFQHFSTSTFHISVAHFKLVRLKSIYISTRKLTTKQLG